MIFKFLKEVSLSCTVLSRASTFVAPLFISRSLTLLRSEYQGLKDKQYKFGGPYIMYSQSDANTSSMEPDSQSLHHRQLDLPAIYSQETMSNYNEDGTSDALNEMSESLIPKIGMEFATVDKAFHFYNAYALQVGFSVQKNLDRNNKSNVITMKCFTCSREGKAKARSPIKALPKFQRVEQRIGCNAHMKINICTKRVYKITSFDSDHNHATSTPTKTKMLKSHRNISITQKAIRDLADATGIKPKKIYELLAKQVGGRRNLTFIPDDYKNYLRTKRERDMALGDAGALMQYLQDRVNHHRQTVIFGAALLYDESAASFEWLFCAFLKATGGHSLMYPQTSESKENAMHAFSTTNSNLLDIQITAAPSSLAGPEKYSVGL